MELGHLRTLTVLLLNAEKRVQCLPRQPASCRLCTTVERGWWFLWLVASEFPSFTSVVPRRQAHLWVVPTCRHRHHRRTFEIFTDEKLV